MARGDISDCLVHWTKGDSDEEAFNVLVKILLEERLIGGTGYIKGSHQCVCFTETPLEFFHNKQNKYKPFGIEFKKIDIYEYGGRPVIYQHDSEFDSLSSDMEWRHVSYNPIQGDGWVDFTWEREWRLQAKSLHVPLDSTVYVKNSYYLERLCYEIQEEYNSRTAYGVASGNYYDGYPWTVQYDIRTIAN